MIRRFKTKTSWSSIGNYQGSSAKQTPRNADMPVVKGLLITIFSLATGIVVASAAGPLPPGKTGVKPAAIVTNAPPKQETLLEIKKKAEAGDARAQVAFGEEFARMQKYTMAEHW